MQYGALMSESVLKIAESGGLLFDGAMGTLLYQRGVFLNRCFEYMNLEQPELVRPFTRNTSRPARMFTPVIPLGQIESD